MILNNLDELFFIYLTIVLTVNMSIEKKYYNKQMLLDRLSIILYNIRIRMSKIFKHKKRQTYESDYYTTQH